MINSWSEIQFLFARYIFQAPVSNENAHNIFPPTIPSGVVLRCILITILLKVHILYPTDVTLEAYNKGVLFPSGLLEQRLFLLSISIGNMWERVLIMEVRWLVEIHTTSNWHSLRKRGGKGRLKGGKTEVKMTGRVINSCQIHFKSFIVWITVSQVLRTHWLKRSFVALF